MRKLLQFSSFVFGALLLSGFTIAVAQPNYCEVNENASSIEIHIFGETYQNADDQQSFASGMTKLFSAFEFGDKIKIVLHKERSQRTTLEQCFPGCPEKGMLEGLFSTSCSEQVAKRDTLEFKNKYIGSIKSAAKMAGEEFNILDHFRNLEDYFSQRTIDDKEVFVFHSMVPFGVDPDDEASLDQAFVKLAQSYDLSEIKTPSLQFVNTNTSKRLNQFWNDLELNGHGSGLNLNIERSVID